MPTMCVWNDDDGDEDDYVDDGDDDDDGDDGDGDGDGDDKDDCDKRFPQIISTSCLLCFGAGVLLSTSLLHMLPEVSRNISRPPLKQKNQLFTSLLKPLHCHLPGPRRSRSSTGKPWD